MCSYNTDLVQHMPDSALPQKFPCVKRAVTIWPQINFPNLVNRNWSLVLDYMRDYKFDNHRFV